ncbi:MAG: hypothetical protein AB8G99_15935 [Planctomycetaceae bacterium]
MKSAVAVLGVGILLLCGWLWLRTEGRPDRSTTPDSVETASQPVPGKPTFSKHIAPIVFDECVACHRPGQVAPFSLISYADVSKRAQQLVEVTSSRYMPPFLPDAEATHFKNARRLSKSQIQTLARWVEQGCVEGNPSQLPPVPHFSSDWQLGEPDIVVAMEKEYTLPPEGDNVFRHFVVGMPNKKLKYIRGFEFRTTNPRIVHHARFLFDATDQSRKLDEADPEPGLAVGMGTGSGRDPDGHWLGWTPGKQPVLREEKHAWPLQPGLDLIIELHMIPTGKPEPVKCELAFYYADKPPTNLPVIIRLGPSTIDIPAGEANYKHAERFQVPVDVDLLNVYPHAHLLGKTMNAFAKTPDGREVCLLKIDEWDFNWQDEYQFAEPIRLPRGSVIDMKFVYDNSSANVRNPHSPPKRVLQGSETDDEMGDLWFQMVPVHAEERPVLNDAVMRREASWLVRETQFLADVRPTAKSLTTYAKILRVQKKYGEARKRLATALKLDPKLVPAKVEMALVDLDEGKLDAAGLRLERILKSGENTNAERALGFIRVRQKRFPDAIPLLKKYLRVTTNDAEAWLQLALASEETGDSETALSCANYVLKLQPTSQQAIDLKIRLRSRQK